MSSLDGYDTEWVVTGRGRAHLLAMSGDDLLDVTLCGIPGWKMNPNAERRGHEVCERCNKRARSLTERGPMTRNLELV